MNEQEHLKTLTDIKSMMERSSRFLSLSGLTGVFIGIYAIAGFIASWYFTASENYSVTSYHRLAFTSDGETNHAFYYFFYLTALIILVLSLCTGFVLTQRKAKKQGLKIWDNTARRLFINLFIPLITGGVFILNLARMHHPELIAPCMLIFYGLALLNASKYTFNDIRYLGIIEIFLGLAASFNPDWGLINWAIGFGVLHIIYGIMMHFKYER